MDQNWRGYEALRHKVGFVRPKCSLVFWRRRKDLQLLETWRANEVISWIASTRDEQQKAGTARARQKALTRARAVSMFVCRFSMSSAKRLGPVAILGLQEFIGCTRSPESITKSQSQV